VALVVMLPVCRRHPRLVRYSFTADFDSISSELDSAAYPWFRFLSASLGVL
jgi:hypothetical protein